MSRNGFGPLLNMTEAGNVLKKDARTVAKWAAERPELVVTLGGQVYIKRVALEALVGAPVSSDDSPRVTIVGANGANSRVSPKSAHLPLSKGWAKIADGDELSQANYDAWLAQQPEEVTS